MITFSLFFLDKSRNLLYNMQLRKGLGIMTYEMQYLKNKKKVVAISLVGVILLIGMCLLNHCMNYEAVKISPEKESVIAAKK